MSTPPVAATVDAQLVAVNVLAASQAVTDALTAAAQDPADPATVGGVWGEARGPFPSIEVISAPGGDWGMTRWHVTDAVHVNVWGNPDRSSSRRDLRALLGVAIDVLCALPDSQAPVQGQIVSNVEVVTPPQSLPEPDGQPRWFAILLFGVHPAVA